MPVDPITASVVQQRLHSIVEEMGEAMLRTACSQILNSNRDFSTAICDFNGRLIAQAEHIPIHVGALPYAARAIRDFFKEDIWPGDIFLLNDPFYGGSHLPDLTVFLPVFNAERLTFFLINRAHQSDIGGSSYGGYIASATEIWHEGIRVTPLRLYDRGNFRRDVLDMLAANVRHSEDFRGDLSAMIGSTRVGERRLDELVREYSWPILNETIEAILDSSERQTRSAIASWRNGIYHGEAIVEDDGHGSNDIHVRATIVKQGSNLTVDLSNSDPQVAGFVNSSYANMRSAVTEAIAFLIDSDIPKNDGVFRSIDVIAKQGTIVWASPGAAVTLSTAHCANEIIEAIITALAPCCPDRAMAGWGRRFRIALQGVDPRTGKSFLWHMFQARPGGGAWPAGDGWPGGGEWHAAGGIKFGSIEVTEARFPLFFLVHEFRPNSGGAGTYRGGAGGILEFIVETAAPVQANTAGEGVRYGARGILGGLDGQPHLYRLISDGRPVRNLRTKEVGIVVRPNDRFIVESGGGGGWGSPTLRSAARRESDVRSGLVVEP